MENRLKIGNEVRELKLGSSFTSPNTRTIFHTLKFDFKPASVDVNKVAKLDVSPNNQVTVTVPHLDGSGVPNTVFKGNQRNYTKKECVLIINRQTNEIILEKLHNNVQVKKTRTETTNKNLNSIAQQQQLHSQQHHQGHYPQQSQLNVPSTSNTNRLENNTTRLSSKTKVSTGVRKNAISFVPKHSPLQGSPSYPHHKSPQAAPAWNANNTQQTLPSIPLIGLDDITDFGGSSSSTSAHPSTSSSMSLVSNLSNIQHISNNNNHDLHNQNQHLTTASSTSLHHHNNTLLGQQRDNLDDSIGILSSSESSSDSESSDSGSESDSTESTPQKDNHPLHHISNGDTNILKEDLQLSESNSDSDDDSDDE